MSTWVWVAVGIAVVIVLVSLALAAMRLRSRRLRERFGPEYDRAIAESPTRREAESALAERERRRSKLDIRPLAPATRERYAAEWQDVQRRFVDEPAAAVAQADALVERVMVDRGYPMADFDEQADLVSVDHPEVVQNYRSAHEIVRAHGAGEAGTEDLRQAMVHYRALFEELLETGAPAERQEVR